MLFQETRHRLTESLVEQVRAAASAGDAAMAASLARQGLASVSLEDIEEIDAGGFTAACLELLDLARRRQPGQPAIRIFDPRCAAHPWPSHHTVIAVVTDDMSFLVDSVSGELARRELTIHRVLHPQITVRRDAAGELEEFTERQAAGEGAALHESFMLFEVDAQTAQASVVDLETALLRVLADVRVTVEDWGAMRDAARRVIAELETEPPPVDAGEVAEAKEFLRWIEDDHFTFLGFLVYGLEDEAGERFLRPQSGSGLGLWRKLPLEARARGHRPLTGQTARFLAGEELIAIAKSAQRSSVHRRVLMDVISVKRFAGGRLVGQYRFLGLFTSVAYSVRASRIPLIRRKVERVVRRASFLPASHNAKGFRHIVETYSRDELFQISEDDLFRFGLRILDLQLRPRLSLLVRHDEAERYVSCLIFVPRDRHSTRLRRRFERILEGVFRGEVSASSTYIGDEPLAQVRFVVRVRPGEIPDYDVARIEERLADAARTWSDRLREALVAAWGEEDGLGAWKRYADAFPGSYADHGETAEEEAIADIPLIERVLERSTFALRLYRREGAAISRFHLRTFELAVPAPLSDLLPQIENMGLEVITEVPFEVRPDHASNPVWIRDFELAAEHGVDLGAVRDKFDDAFHRVWRGEVENDPFNRLVLRAGLEWRQVVLLRAYAKYLRQIGGAFSQRYLARTLARNPAIVVQLVELFTALLDPDRAGEDRAETARAAIARAFEEVKSPDEDRILRHYWNLIEATLRTNYFQTPTKPYLALKFDATRIDDLPEPRPRYEIFVYSPEVEAVHLRGGKVARGGIRWSDRREDFRTEVLGLVKAQMVKNAVIVPVGAKGGFVVKRPPKSTDREEIQAHGVHCYKTMIRALLDVTDNLDGGRLAPPPRVVRRDDDDPYLVVAADKGTATFSDVANQVSAEYRFWLGDAFASGGSVGYDHKKMAITARGAWESVKRHFRELGHDVQAQDLTVVGVGDMSGDVFGNAMLLSEHLRLVAAFNHQHVFVDPDPDPARSFAERARLFRLPRSSWSDYDRAALSAGGAVYDRHALRIELAPEARELLQIAQDAVTPQELIRAILKAPVDLLWLGGIGTYVKASSETHAQVGDRANDEVRVDAAELQTKVVGEGANLGLTQAGRIEYALTGGRVNTDYIDNSGGVDCSDHEVNIKIVLEDAVRSGRLAGEERVELLRGMTDEVAELVLRDNYLQTQSISLTEAQGAALLDEQERLMIELERRGQLSRRLEGLPGEATLAERRQAGRGLTRPEIAALLAASKIYVYNELLDSPLPDEEQLVEDLLRYFPRPMRQRFRDEILRHRLRREIIATHVTNSMLNRVGPTFVPRMEKETGHTVSQIARAYTAARDIFDARSLWADVEKLDNQVPASLQTEMTLKSVRMLERATRWFLRYGGRAFPPDPPRGGRPLDVSGLVTRFEADIVMVAAQLEDMLPGRSRERLRRGFKRLREAGVPAALAERVAALEIQPSACDVARCAAAAGAGVERVGRIYFALGESFGFDRLLRDARKLAPGSPWQQRATMALVEDLYSHQADITCQVAAAAENGRPKAAIELWAREHPEVERLRQLLKDIQSTSEIDLAMLAVAERELRRLAER